MKCFVPHCPIPTITDSSLKYEVAVPTNFAKSLEGKYFIGYADNLTFGHGTSAWAGGKNLSAINNNGLPRSTMADHCSKCPQYYTS